MNPAPHGLGDQEIPSLHAEMYGLAVRGYTLRLQTVPYRLLGRNGEVGVGYFLGYCDKGGPVSLRGVGRYDEDNDFIIGSECRLDLEWFFPSKRKGVIMRVVAPAVEIITEQDPPQADRVGREALL